mgnify:FL=1|jgi:hypothetical protein|tara:strand:- start:1984 stop:2184 length:201 start_codon:yes stop_codon:yes gene_type:complete
MANSSKDQKWIQKAIKRPGAFKSSAEKAGMSTKAFANKVTDNPSKFSKRKKKQASLAKTLMGMKKS